MQDPSPLPPDETAAVKAIATDLAAALCEMDLAALNAVAALDIETQGEVIDCMGLRDENGKIRWKNRAFDDFGEYMEYYDAQQDAYFPDAQVKVNRVTLYEEDELNTVFENALEIECIGYEIAPEIADRYETTLDTLQAKCGAIAEVIVDTLDTGYVLQVCLLEIDGEWKSVSPTAIGMLGGGTAGPTLRYLRKINQ